MTDFEVFDIHHHMADTGVSGRAPDERPHDDQGELATRLRIMDQRGVAHALAIPGHNYCHADGIAATRRRNDAIAAYRDRLPGRFPVAAGIVEPTSEKAGLAELERISDELGLRAVSFHPEHQGAMIDFRWTVRYLERMGELGLVPLVHASDTTPHDALWRLAKVARALPGLTIVALESFFTLEGLQQCAFIADVAPTVLFDTTTAFDTDMLLHTVAEVGAERFVFGSIQYSHVNTGSRDLANVRRNSALLDDIRQTSLLDDAAKSLVLGDNARKVLSV